MASQGRAGTDPTRGTEPGGSPARPLNDQAAELGRDAQRGAERLADDVQAWAGNRARREKQEAATTLSRVADRLQASGHQLRTDHEDLAGEYIEKAARQLERAAEYVRTTSLDEAVQELEDFARRRPAAFVGSAFAIGLLAARFLKSSPTRRTMPGDQAAGARRFADRDVTAPPAIEPWPVSADPRPDGP
jgi:ElaB/YqjD/DUF883 family membrane-anchored ribosome-binding protein